MMENLRIHKPEITIGKPGSDRIFGVEIEVKLSDSGNALRHKEVIITVGDEKLLGPKNPSTNNPAPWKTNYSGYLKFGFKRGEGTYRVNLWIDDAEPLSLTPVKLEIPKLGGFHFTKPEELKGDKGSYFVKFNCLDNKSNTAAGTIEFETQPNRPIRIDDLNDGELGEGVKFALSVPTDGISVVIRSMDSLPVILTLVEKRTIVKTIEFPKLDKPIIKKATSFTLSNLKPNPCSDGSYILKVNLENDGNPASGYVTFITEQHIEVYNHVNDKLLDKTGNAGKPPQILISASGKFVRIKPIKELTTACKMDVHLVGTGFTKTVEFAIDTYNGKKPVNLAPTNWYPMGENTYCIPIALLDENDNAFGVKGNIYYSSDKETNAGINNVTDLKKVGIVDVVSFDIPTEGANLIIKFEGRKCDIFLGLECGAKTKTITLY